MSFDNRQIKGEGTDYVGPWIASSNYDLNSGQCRWEKKYVGKHSVVYSGRITESGIPRSRDLIPHRAFSYSAKKVNHLNELSLRDELTEPSPSVLLEPVNELGFLKNPL